MNKYTLLLLGLFIGLSGFKDTPLTSNKGNKSNLQLGEKYTYLCRMGFVNAGKATVLLDTKMYKINNYSCAKVMVKGWTIGAVDFFYDVEDKWITYIDTKQMIPRKFIRNIKENNYKLQEETIYHQKSKKARLRQYYPNCNQGKGCAKKKSFPITANAQDMVSSYYYLRTINFDNMKKNQSFFVNMVYEDTVYHLELFYMGKEVISTKFGKIKSFIVSPKMPENKLFSGKNPIKIWISNDANKVPLRCKAKLVVGSIIIELTNYKNTKEKFRFY